MKPILRMVFIVCVAIVFAGVLLTVYMAGMSVFAGPVNWQFHKQWGWTLFLPVVVLLPLALLGRFPRRIVLMSGLLLILIMVQYFLPKLRESITQVSAFHPVNAMLIFTLTAVLLTQVWQFLRSEQKLVNA